VVYIDKLRILLASHFKLNYIIGLACDTTKNVKYFVWTSNKDGRFLFINMRDEFPTGYIYILINVKRFLQ
jgi:hypothetical protein